MVVYAFSVVSMFMVAHAYLQVETGVLSVTSYRLPATLYLAVVATWAMFKNYNDMVQRL